MARQPPSRRGWWYLLSLSNVAFLFMALRGLFGQEAREESEVALGDWARVTRPPLGYAILVVLSAIVVVAVVVLLLRT